MVLDKTILRNTIHNNIKNTEIKNKSMIYRVQFYFGNNNFNVI